MTEEEMREVLVATMLYELEDSGYEDCAGARYIWLFNYRQMWLEKPSDTIWKDMIIALLEEGMNIYRMAAVAAWN